MAQFDSTAARPRSEETLPAEESIEVILPPEEGADEAAVEAEAPLGHYDNLVPQIDTEVLTKLYSSLKADIDVDIGARSDWEKGITSTMKLLGFKYEERSEPWSNACGAFHPVLAEAVVRYQAEAITETFPAQGPVMVKIVGNETPEKRQAAARVKDDMNYYVTEVMTEFREEHERALFAQALMGCAFKMVYNDESLKRPVSMFVSPEDVILPYGCTVLSTSPRVTRRLRMPKYQLEALSRAGYYDFGDTPEDGEVAFGGASNNDDKITAVKDEITGVSENKQELYTLYEIRVRTSIEGIDTEFGVDGTPIEVMKPYIVTLAEGAGKVVGVRRNWLEDDPLRLARQDMVKYTYVPGFGPYGFGLLHLIGASTESVTSTLRQLVDAGTLSNLPAGYKTKGMRVSNSDDPLKPGEFRDVDVPSGTLKENVVPLPFKEPSATLYNLMNTMVEDARRFAATSDLDVTKMSAQAPVGTTLALLERMLKTMSAVQARTHASLKQELKLLAPLIVQSAPEYGYDVFGGQEGTKKQDYSTVDIIPVSDPNASTLSQRVVLWQAVHQLATTAPNIYDMRELHRSMLSVMGVKEVDKLVPVPQEMQPTDPLTENMNVLNTKPVRAFLTQDHRAHIAVHTSLLQDPMIMEMVGQGPNANAITGAIMAHINEHLAFGYRQQMEQALGVQLPPAEQPLPPEVEAQMSPMLAEAAKMVLAQNKNAFAEKQAQMEENDPLTKLQKEELRVKEKKVDMEALDSERDFITENRKLALAERQASDKATGEGLKIGTNVAIAKMNDATKRATAAYKSTANKPNGSKK